MHDLSALSIHNTGSGSAGHPESLTHPCCDDAVCLRGVQGCVVSTQGHCRHGTCGIHLACMQDTQEAWCSWHIAAAPAAWHSEPHLVGPNSSGGRAWIGTVNTFCSTSTPPQQLCTAVSTTTCSAVATIGSTANGPRVPRTTATVKTCSSHAHVMVAVQQWQQSIMMGPSGPNRWDGPSQRAMLSIACRGPADVTAARAFTTCEPHTLATMVV